MVYDACVITSTNEVNIKKSLGLYRVGSIVQIYLLQTCADMGNLLES